MENSIFVDGVSIPRVDDSRKYFLNVLTILFGPSGTGKSSLIRHILNTIRDVVPIGLVCCPTNATNGDYTNIIPDECIYDEVSAKFMRDIFTRQTNVLAMYNLVRSLKDLQPIFELVADQESNSKIIKIDKVYKQGIDMIKSSYDTDEAETALSDLKERNDKKIVSIMRKCIISKISSIDTNQLTDIQKTIVSNLEINPNLLLIIDDCAASIKEWRDLEETKQLFFQGRHFKVTTILTMQNESIIPVPLRANAHISIFTTNKIASTYYTKASSGVSTTERKRIERIAETIFASTGNKPNYKKMVAFSNLVNTDPKIQFIIANPKRKKFGSPAVWAFCDRVKRTTPNAINNSSFAKMFHLKSTPQL